MTHSVINRRTACVFLVSASLLLFELTLTRLLSVTLWYHYASFAITLALFGTAAAGVAGTLVRSPRGANFMSRACALQAVAMVLTTLAFLELDLRPDVSLAWLAKFLFALGLFSVPFFLGSLVVLEMLRQRPAPIAILYASDLAGAAAACLCLVPLLDTIAGPSVVLVAAALAAAAALFSTEAAGRGRAGATVLVLLLVAGLAGNELGKAPWFRVRLGKFYDETHLLHEKWTSLCRIGVIGEDHGHLKRYPDWAGWGMSAGFKGKVPRQLWLEQDGSAGTPLTEFHGELASVEHLRHDVTSVAYLLRPRPRALIVGAGGGRDILAALACGARSVTAVEINPAIVDVVERHFRDFTGGPYSLPGVKTVVAEGRTFVATSRERYDALQISLIDSWAASAAGGYVFNESALYTREAFDAYLDHLTPEGTLTLSRWNSGTTPFELLRLASLARAALERRGIPSARDHVSIVKSGIVATVLIDLAPSTPERLARLREVCRREQFEVMAPGGNDLLNKLLGDPGWRELADSHQLDLSPPTDDRPFFFHPMKLSTFLSGPSPEGDIQENIDAIRMLASLVPTTAVLAALCLLFPLRYAGSAVSIIRPRPAMLVHFGCLGAGYMLVEMAMLGRLVSVLGHPSYAVSVVLAVMLLLSAVGSASLWLGKRQPSARIAFSGVLLCLTLLLGAMEFLWPTALHWPFFVRILLVLATLGPAAFFMGMPFALGLSRIDPDDRAALAWAWAANGSLSVFAGITATWLAVLWGFRCVIVVAIAVYAGAALASRTAFGPR